MQAAFGPPINHQTTIRLRSLMFIDNNFLIPVKARAKHDMTNTVAAGCVTGGTLSAKGGPKAACIGCAGFAAFSVVIEKFLDRHE
nr:mitochondrial import inner membrane translocase subunit TIM22-4-like [Tanacetum cinerariifolium]